MKIQSLIQVFLLTTLLTAISCSNGPEITEIPENQEQPEDNDDQESDSENDDEEPEPQFDIAGDVEIFDENLVDTNPILINDAINNLVYLINKKGEIIFDWNINNGNLGNDCIIEDDGKLLAMLESEEPMIQLGGHGGKIELLDKEGNVEWEFTYSSEDYVLHHDAERLPNGNILLMVWERIDAETAVSYGYKQNIDIFPDAIIEVNPATNEIVWEWHMWDHIVQDFDDSAPNYGVISENNQLIDINYNQLDTGDVSHANGIAYSAEDDLIYLSVNFYHEIWVIDHSTSTLEATSSEGGAYGKGGDLVYRFGNPEAYQDTEATRLFHNNHHPNLINNTTLLVFGNGTDIFQSTVFELKLPEEFTTTEGIYNPPIVQWDFTDPDLFSARVSGAVVLPNGNILITEGDFGLWEVTREKEIVWKFSGDGFYWRSYSYTEDKLKSNGILKNTN